MIADAQGERAAAGRRSCGRRRAGRAAPSREASEPVAGERGHDSAAAAARSGAGSLEPAAVHAQPARHRVGQRRVVGDQQQRHRRARRRRRRSGRPPPGRCRASRLPVGSSASSRLRPVDQRPRQRHALLLAARELARDSGRRGARGPPRAAAPAAAAKASRSPASSSGSATFSSAVMVGIRWNDWNRMPIRSRRNRASPSSSSVPRSTPSTQTRPRGRPLDPADDRHQAGLAGARGTHHAYARAGLDHEVDAAQDRHRSRGARKGEMHVCELDHRQRPGSPLA